MNKLVAQRNETLRGWLQSQGLSDTNLTEPLADASFRRYFRVNHAERTAIVMDAPPEKEPIGAFLTVRKKLNAAGLRVPQILAMDEAKGFILLEDLGSIHLADRLASHPDARNLEPAVGILPRLARVDASQLPAFDATMVRAELQIFVDWFVQRHCQERMDPALWERTCACLTTVFSEQPRIFVHRDFHAMNLLEVDDGLAIIDFQDAVRGPVSYDAISLLWDRQPDWATQQRRAWLLELRDLLHPGCDLETWFRWCEWTALQRNLKILGIFCRLYYRDSKPRYLALLPRFWNYVLELCAAHREFRTLLVRLESLQWTR